MPKLTKDGRPKQSELPDTLKRSPAKAQRQFAETHDAAAEQYGEGERAHRTAFASLKHNFEKVGDHWETKDEPGPSDPRSKQTTANKRRGRGQDLRRGRRRREHQAGAVRPREAAWHRWTLDDVEGRARTRDRPQAVTKGTRRSGTLPGYAQVPATARLGRLRLGCGVRAVRPARRLPSQRLKQARTAS